MIMVRHRDLRTAALLGVLLFGFAGATGCGDVPGDAEDTGSILKVELITGWEDQEDKNTVDVVPGTCEAGEGEIDPEPFFDHLARVEVTNRPLPNTDEQTASPVYIRSYTITYQAIGDTVNGPLPDLLGYVNIPVQDTRGVPPCDPGQSSCSATEYFLHNFFHIEKKQEYLERVCGASFHPSWPAAAPTVPYPDRCTWVWVGTYWMPAVAQGEYNVRFTFHGENLFGEEFTFGAATAALIDNYDNCD